MEGLVGERHVPPSTIAGIYVSLGEHADALRWLEQAYRERDSMLTLMNYWPAYDALRSDPRFRRLVARIRLDA